MCTSVIAGKKATKGGVVLIARDEDFDVNNWNKYLKPLREPQYKTDSHCIKGDIWQLGNGLQVSIPSKAFRYCSSPDAEGSLEADCSIGDHYFFEERGFNEKNLMISATNSMEINEAAKAADPVVAVGIEESIIPTLILPQAETALEAVERLGGYVELYGAAEANGIAIGDEKEIWYMEIGSGHHWIAVRVPEECYLAVSNCMRIRGVDLEDKENVKCSEKIYEFVTEKKLLLNPDKNKFDFAGAFGCYEKTGENPDPYYNVDRIWLIQHLLTPLLNQEIRQKEYPLFLEPSEEITIKMVAEVLRAGYQGTPLEELSKRPIGVARTAESHIMILDPSMPEGLEGMIWQTVGTPLGCPFMPLYPFVEEMPRKYAVGGSNYDKESAYWKFRGLFSAAGCMGKEKALCIFWKTYEEELFDEFERVQGILKKIAEKDREAANTFIQNYSIGVLLRTAQAAEEKMTEVLTQMAQER